MLAKRLDPVPRRRPRPRGEGRALRVAPRRRRSRRGAPRATTPAAPTSSSSSTSRRPRTRGRSCSTWCGAWPRPSTCRSPWAAACGASRTRRRCCAPGPTRSRSTPRPSAGPSCCRSWRCASARRPWCSRSTRARGDEGFEVFVHGGRTPTGKDAVAWAREGAERGAGEILLTSMDRDGTKDGFDLALTRAVASAVRVPVVASGGCGSVAHMAEALTDGRASAALAASVFHFGEIRIPEAKAELLARGVCVRPPAEPRSPPPRPPEESADGDRDARGARLRRERPAARGGPGPRRAATC